MKEHTHESSHLAAKESKIPGLVKRIAPGGLTFRAVALFIAIVMLMIPLASIEKTSRERSSRANAVLSEIASSWGAENTTLTTPFLAIPYTLTFNDEVDERVLDKDNPEQKPKWKTVKKSIRRSEKKWWNLVPETLNMDIRLDVMPRQRGIFSANTFVAQNTLRGRFLANAPLKLLKTLEDSDVSINWEQARLIWPVADSRMLRALPTLSMAATPLAAEMRTGWGNTNMTVVIADVTNLSAEKLGKGIAFGLDAEVAGVGTVAMIPVATHANITMDGNWPEPSFLGDQIPEARTISPVGFTARWKDSIIRRGISSSTLGHSVPDSILRGQEGSGHPRSIVVRLYNSVSIYLKMERVFKYGFLFLALTFGTFWLIEIRQRARLHLVQYALIGCANIIFFLLVLSFSEHIGFDWAYGLGAALVTMMIGLYVKACLGRWGLAVFAKCILATQYAVVFLLLREEDLALVGGSLALFASLAVVMWFTRRIDHDLTKDDLIKQDMIKQDVAASP
jgi:inner membrane protein